MAPPWIDTSIVPKVPGVLYALFDYGLTNEVITILKTQQDLKTEDYIYLEYLINIIGEPVIKNKLLRMLDEKNFRGDLKIK